LIPEIKNEKDLIFIYGYDIILDASLSKDEKLMRAKQSYKLDLELLFAWECPLFFKNICIRFSEFSNNNKKLTLRFSDYQALINTPTNQKEDFEFILKLKKNNRFNSKSFIVSIQKPKANFNNNYENKINDTISIQNPLSGNIEDLLFIDYRLSKSEDIFFELKSFDDSINYSSISITWLVQHFSNKDLYLNGQNENLLRIKIFDLLIGNNEIICEITNIFTSQIFRKLLIYNVDRNPYGGNCLVSPNLGISMSTNFTIIQEGWKGGAMPLLFKVKCRTNSNIFLDISNGGFFSQTFNLNKLPEGNNNIFLEVSDQQGRFVLFPCLVKVKHNDNQQSIENYITNINNISQKMIIMDIFTSYVNEKKDIKVDEKKEIAASINILDTYYEELSYKFEPNKFFENFDKIVSFLVELSNKNLKEIKLEILSKTINLIISNIDPFIDDLNKMSVLYKIIDKLSENIKIKIGEISGIFIYKFKTKL